MVALERAPSKDREIEGSSPLQSAFLFKQLKEMKKVQMTNHLLLERSKLFARYAENIPRKTDIVELVLDDPDCGWIDMHFKVNGEEQIVISASDVYEPFKEIREWLENIAINIFNKAPSGVRFYDETYNYNLYYEPLIQDSGELYDHYRTDLLGLFYIYDESVKQIVSVAFCDTEKFVKTIYRSILAYAEESRNKEIFVEGWIEGAYNREWGILEEDDDPRIKDIFYNKVKSPFLDVFVTEGLYKSRDYLRIKAEEEISKLKQ